MHTLQDRRAGLLLGSFIAESLSLGVHWIYDTNALAGKFGYVTDYYAPGADSYHPKKQAGDQGHVGDQALCLATFLVREKKWEREGFMNDWLALWPRYEDYLDHATKTVLDRVEHGKRLGEAYSTSSELAGPARIAPLLAFLADKGEAEAVQAAVEQTVLTHRSSEAEAAAVFLAQASFRLMHGASFEETLQASAPPWALNAAQDALAFSAVEAIGKLGQSCPIQSALPAVIYLALKHGDNVATAFSENAMAGGDNCARGLALGMLLGAAHGLDALPQAWQDKLIAKPLLDGLLELG